MEKLSNNRTDYWNKIKLELLDSPESSGFRFRYLEVGQLLTHGYSITQLTRNPYQLALKIWNAEFDNKRFDKGIYNLDRLAINEKTVELSSDEAHKIQELLQKEFNLSDWNGIVLDGLFCQLELDNKKINWNCNEEITNDLIELVEWLRNKNL